MYGDKRVWTWFVGGCVSLVSFPSNGITLDDMSERVDLHADVRVEGYLGEGLDNSDQGDIRVDYAQLGFDTAVNDVISAHMYALHEDDGTDPWELDQAYLALTYNGYHIDAGRQYVPFGTLQVNMITDPLTYSLTETRETALLFGVDYQGFYGSVYVFNGEVNEVASAARGDDSIEHFGFSVGFAAELNELSFDVGFDYINSVGEAFVIRELTGSPVQEYVGGFVLRGTGRYGPFSLLAEYVDTGEFNAADLAFKGGPAELYALNFEVGMDFYFLGNESTVSVGMQFTDEAVALSLPESRFSIGLRSSVMDNTSVGLEFRWDDDYAQSDGGTDNDAVTLSAQLQVLF